MLLDKTREVTRTLLPVAALVLLLCFTVVRVDSDVMVRFIAGSIMLLIGLSVFLWGVDLAMNPIGEHMSWEVATSRTSVKIAVLSFLLGFLVTVAEPDLLILGSQVGKASGGTLGPSVVVYMVSVGVGIMISLGVFRLLKGRPLNVFMAITYGVIFVLAIFVSEEFLAIAFDASGATTGALTTPFVLALSVGLSRAKGGRHSEENSFGLVGIMSSGPILAITIMSIVSGQKHIHGAAPEFVVAKGVWGPLIALIPSVLVEALVALIPLTALFFFLNYRTFKLPCDEISGILKGLLYCFIGLVLFLAAVNLGFMDMGRIIGMRIAETSHWLLVGVGFLLGLIVVLVEPAVHVLGEQIEEVTSGYIPPALIKMTFSIGVGIAIALSMLRIIIPGVKLWYFIIPGFAIAILLSFVSDPVFVGIAYDAGGVASGPMSATFVLAFAQGAASVVDTANVLVDGFGVIAMVAMAPVLSIMVLGTAFRHKRVERVSKTEEEELAFSLPQEEDLLHSCIMVVVNRGYAEKAVEIARSSGATGATIVRGRGTGEQKVRLPVINLELQPEKEIVLLVTLARVVDDVSQNLLGDEELGDAGGISVFVSPSDAMVKSGAVCESDVIG